MSFTSSYTGAEIDTAISKAHDQAHGLGSVEHTPTTLAQLNAKISDAILIDTTDPRLAKELKIHSIGSVAVNTNLDCSVYNYFTIEPTSDITLTFTNVVAGTACIVQLLGAGDHTLTWAGGTFVWDGGTAPTLTTGTLNALVSFITNDGTTLRGKLIFTEV